MNKAAFPIFARLLALQTAARITAGGYRVIASTSDGDPLAALLREVNETLLSRTLTFDSSSGSSLSLDVSGRRVLRVIEAVGLPDAETCLAADALEDDHKSHFIKLIQALATPGHELRVLSARMMRDAEGVSVGLPVALLADLLLIDLNPVEGETRPERSAAPTTRDVAERQIVRAVAPAQSENRPVTGSPRLSAPLPEAAPTKPVQVPETERKETARPALAGVASSSHFLIDLVHEIGPILMAWVIVGGQSDGEADGPDEMVSHLQGFLSDESESLAAQFDQVSNEAGKEACIVLGASVIEGHSIVCARSGPGILLGLIEGDATQTVLRAWAVASAGRG